VISREQKAAKCQNGPCNASEFCDFQAEYEGSIPFTRSSSSFNDLFQHLRLISNPIQTSPKLGRLMLGKIREYFQAHSKVVEMA